MTAISGGNPQRGVRYVFQLASSDDEHALYDVSVSVADRSVTVRVKITGAGTTFEGPHDGVEPAHQAQLVALAKTLARREDSPWPRRVERWRSPGVR